MTDDINCLTKSADDNGRIYVEFSESISLLQFVSSTNPDCSLILDLYRRPPLTATSSAIARSRTNSFPRNIERRCSIDRTQQQSPLWALSDLRHDDNQIESILRWLFNWVYSTHSSFKCKLKTNHNTNWLAWTKLNSYLECMDTICVFAFQKVPN